MSPINCAWTAKKDVVPRIGMVASKPPVAPHQMVASKPPTANQRTARPSPPTVPPLSTVSSTTQWQHDNGAFMTTANERTWP